MSGESPKSLPFAPAVTGFRQVPPSPRLERAAPSLPRAPLSLHIDRLLLDGLPLAAAERHRVQAAIVTELQFLFGSGALHAELRAGITLPRLWLDAIQLCAAATPEQIGAQIACALHRGLGS